MSGTHGHLALDPNPLSGNAGGNGLVHAVASGVWTAGNLMSIILPSAGRWLIQVISAGRISDIPPTDTTLFARLFDVTNALPVPNTQTTIVRLTNANVALGATTVEAASPLSALVTITGLTAYRLEHMHNSPSNQATSILALSFGNGGSRWVATKVGF